MPFDMNAVLADPQFQMGLGLMGVSSPRNKPMLEAYQLLQAQEQRKQTLAMQQAQMQNMQSEAGLRAAQASQSGIQGQVMQQDMALKQRTIDMQTKAYQDAMGMLKGLGIGGGGGGGLETPNPAQPQAGPQPQAPAIQAAAPTPMSNVFSNADGFVAKTEGGYVANDAGKGPTNFGINQTANPDVNVKNLTPEQAVQIRKQRYWDAIGADNLPPQTAMVAYDAAVNQGQQYAKNLLEKTGGNPQLMLYQRRQDYQNLAKSNPTMAAQLPAWNSRLNNLQAQLNTADSAPTQAAAPKSNGSMEPARAMQIAGGLVEMPMNPGAGLTTIGKALTPQVLTPGSYSKDVYGNMTQTPDPKGEAAMRAEQQRVELAQRELALKQYSSNREDVNQALTQQKQKATDFGQVTSVLDNTKTLTDAAAALRNNPGLDHVTGRYSSLPDSVRKMIDPQGMNAKADLDAIGSKVLLSTITALKSLSSNGSTGFGQLSNIEGEHLINSVASLKQAQTTQQIKDRLATVIKSANAAMDRSVSVYEQTHDSSPYEGLPVGTRPLRDAKTGEQQMSKAGNQLLKLPNGKLVEVRQ